jgi:hypothetical protein
LATPQSRPKLASILPGVALGLLLAAPGLWFGIKLNQGIDFVTSAEAATIQVFERLPHHLQPYQFRDGYVQRHAILAALLLLLCSVTTATDADRRFRWFVGGGILLALLGFGLACWSQYCREFPAWLLRFYWFRLSDCMTPLGASIVGLQYLVSLQVTRKVSARWWLAGLIVLSVYDASLQVRHVPGLSSSTEATIPRADKNVVYQDWRDACSWAAEHTPPGAGVWYTRRQGIAESGRGETANWKDMPQDGKRIVEWWRRLNEVFGTGKTNPKERWYDSLSEAGAEHLQKMAAKYGAQYAIVELNPDLPRLPLEQVYENDSYAIYHLTEKE